jgi:hypothetical protein
MSQSSSNVLSQELSQSKEILNPPNVESASRVESLRKALYNMSVENIAGVFQDFGCEHVPSTLAAALGDPQRQLSADRVSTTLEEYGERIIRDAEMIMFETNPYDLFLLFLAQGLRPEQCSLALLIDMIVRLKPSCAQQIAGRLAHFDDRFSIGLRTLLLSQYSSTSGNVSHAVFSMLMEFLNVYLTCDYTSSIPFTPLYYTLLKVQKRATYPDSLSSAQFSTLVARVCQVQDFRSVPFALLCSGLQNLAWMTSHLTPFGASRLKFAAQKANAFFRLVVWRRGSIVPPPQNGQEEAVHPSFTRSKNETPEQRGLRYDQAESLRHRHRNAPRFLYLQENNRLDEKTDGARAVLRYCIDAWANVLLLHLATYPSYHAFGPCGSASKDVTRVMYSDLDDFKRTYKVDFDWKVDSRHFSLDLPTAALFQLERLLMQPTLHTAAIHLADEEEAPARARLPSVACKPKFGAGSNVYQCSNPVVIPMLVLKQLLNDSDFRLVVDLTTSTIKLE